MMAPGFQLRMFLLMLFFRLLNAWLETVFRISGKITEEVQLLKHIFALPH